MMNRDESRLIKIPDANPMAAGTGEGGGVGPPNAGQQNSAPVFPQRPSLIEVPQMPVGSNLGGSGSGGPLQAHRTGVTAYRGEPAGVGPPALPPAAHTGVILTTSASPGAAPQPPSVVMHGPQSTVMSQLPSTVKPEPISLPTAPVSIQYANTFPGGGPLSANSGPPAAVKTLANSLPVTMSQSVQSIVHNLQQQQQHQQQQQQQQSQVATTIQQVVHTKPPNHQGVNLSSLAAFRTLTSTPNLTVIPNVTPGGNMNNSAMGIASCGANSNSANFQRLKVEDALSYLDQVKYKFGNQPQVYNDFLDIMKEFKSQSIDTPGVIARVSSLFRGHPELIVGFNTFLPPGYKIEVHSNDSIAVSMPGSMGATVQTIVHTPHGIHKMTTHGSGPLTSITTSNTGHVQPMQQQHLPQAPPPPQQGNVIRMHLPSVGLSSTTLTGLNTPKFLPQSQQQQQHGVKKESLNSNSVSGGYHPGLGLSGVHLPTTPLLHTSSSQLPTAAAQAVTQVRQQMQQQQQSTLPSGLASVSQASMGPMSEPAGPVVGAQPVEFNHAINYVNKIKNRFQGQPDVYKQFLEILHTYQKDQKAIKEGHQPTGPYLTEAEVYAQVSKLFQNQEDLLAEFGQFLPEATGENSMMSKGLSNDHSLATKKPVPMGNNFKFGAPKFGLAMPGAQSSGSLGPTIGLPSTSIKRPPSGVAHPPPKKQKTGDLRDVSLAEAGKYGTLNEYAFFDKVRKALRSQEVYNNFLRCLVLFNQEVISRGELVQITTPFLGRHPELFKWFKDFVGYSEGAFNSSATPDGSGPSTEVGPHQGVSGVSGGRSVEEDRVRIESERGARERISAECAMEIDYATCKRLGASYCALPKNFVQPSCSGRTALCKEVLNDTWVSFPSWSEDSTFVTSRKTQYEEAIYRTEDERFEFDVVLETNKDTIKVLECVQKKMTRMPPEEAARYRLDDCLGGTSLTVHQRAIRRIYGDKAADIVEGLKRNPVVAVPLVLRRLRAKDEEWREVQKNFNKIWREQNEKYYLKSLDHQSLMFKQSDIRNLRSKSLLSEIETLYDERHEQSEDNENGSANSAAAAPAQEGPHLSLTYQDFSVLDDANNLLIHHVKRQTSIHKEDKHKIKVLLKHFLMDRFRHPRQDLSDDEREDDNDSGKDDEEGDSESGNGTSGSKSTRSERARKKQLKEESSKNSFISSSNNNKIGSKNSSENSDSVKNKEIGETDIKIEPKDGRRTPLHARDMEPDESYTMLMANNWYLFLRLHHLLCERLTKMYNQAIVVANEETKDKKDRKESTAVALRLKPKNEVEPEDYYPAFLDMVKNLLDGNMDSQTYEDTLREMFGIHAYISFTLDKVVGNAVRQLQHLVTDEVCVECYDLFLSQSKRNGTGGNCGSAAERQIPELIYQKKAEKLLTDENCMKIILYHQSGSMTIELLDTETEGQDSDKEEEATRKYQSYLDVFIGPGDEISDECRSHLISKPVFLPRSIRSFNKRSRERQTLSKLRENSSHNVTSVTSAGNNSVTLPKDDSSEANASESDRPPIKHEDDVVYEDNTQCQFNLKNFKILYIINSENCFYRRLALRRATTSHKSVSLRKSSAFSFWHASWVRQNVPDTAHHSIEQWFMGKSDQLVPNRTQKLSRSSQEKAPYRQYLRYKVDLPKTIPNDNVSAVGVTSSMNMLSTS